MAIKGGANNDTINGGLGRDNLYGGPGKDILIGGPDQDDFFLNFNDNDIEDSFDGVDNNSDTLYIYGNDNQEFTINLSDVLAVNIGQIYLSIGNQELILSVEDLTRISGRNSQIPI